MKSSGSTASTHASTCSWAGYLLNSRAGATICKRWQSGTPCLEQSGLPGLVVLPYHPAREGHVGPLPSILTVNQYWIGCWELCWNIPELTLMLLTCMRLNCARAPEPSTPCSPQWIQARIPSWTVWRGMNICFIGILVYLRGEDLHLRLVHFKGLVWSQFQLGSTVLCLAEDTVLFLQ